MAIPYNRVVTATSSLSVRRTLRLNSRCLLHTTSATQATPVPHPTVPGPPPDAPQAAVTYAADRVARKRQHVEALRQSQEAKANPAKPTSVLQKRFWKNVSVKETTEGLQIHLDTRPVRNSKRQVITLPPSKRALASAIALEWDQLVNAQQALKQHYVPLTSLTSRATDLETADADEGLGNKIRENIINTLMRYLATDTLLCWAPAQNRYSPDRPGVKSLRERQKDIAEPIIAFLTAHIFPGLEIVPILGEDSIVPIAQPEITRQVIRGWMSRLPANELAALERGTLATKSVLVAARLLVEWSTEFAHLRTSQQAPDVAAERFGIEAAAEAASLEVLHQTAQWGEVEDTHDVDKEDLKRQLGSVVLIV
ncbi:hypothetical protein BDY17DRAFT_302649, partial [Neohortaea acidophila]